MVVALTNVDYVKANCFQECAQVLLVETEMCASLGFLPAVAICETCALVAFGICTRAC